MPETTVVLRFRAVYEHGLSQAPDPEEELYGANYFPGMRDFVAGLNDVNSVNYLSAINDRFPIVSDLKFTDAGDVPIFTGELTVTYEAGSQSFTELLPYVTGELHLNRNPQEWVPSEEANNALVSLLNNILWVPPWGAPRIIGMFTCAYTSIKITDGNGEQEYPVDPYAVLLGSGFRSSGGAGGGLR